MAGRTPLSSELEAARVDRDEVLGRLTRTARGGSERIAASNSNVLANGRWAT